MEGNFDFAVRLCPFPFCFEVLLLPRNFPRKVELGTCRFLKLGFASGEFVSRTLPVCFAPNFALCYSTKNSTNFCYRTWKNSVEILVGILKISRTDFKNNSYGFSNLSCTDSKIFLILYESINHQCNFETFYLIAYFNMLYLIKKNQYYNTYICCVFIIISNKSLIMINNTFLISFNLLYCYIIYTILYQSHLVKLNSPKFRKHIFFKVKGPLVKILLY